MSKVICNVSSMQRNTGHWRVQGRIVEDDGAIIELENCGWSWRSAADGMELDIRALLSVIRPGVDVKFRYISGESERLMASDYEDWGEWDYCHESSEEGAA